MTKYNKHVLDLIDTKEFQSYLHYPNIGNTEGTSVGFCWKEGEREIYSSTKTSITEKYRILNPDYTSAYGEGNIEVNRGLREGTLYQFLAPKVIYTPVQIPEDCEKILFASKIVKTWEYNSCKQIEPVYQTIKSYKKPKAEVKPRIVMLNNN